MDTIKLLKSFLEQHHLSIGDEEAKLTVPGVAAKYDSIESGENEIEFE